jgi:outer membrane murein-binding lipoprotein Lpp
VIEIYAAVIGASIGIAGMTASGLGKRSTESRETVIRLTVAVENIAEKLDQLHQDMRADRVEIYSRLNNCETRITSLEARPD